MPLSGKPLSPNSDIDANMMQGGGVGGSSASDTVLLKAYFTEVCVCVWKLLFKLFVFISVCLHVQMMIYTDSQLMVPQPLP